MKLRRFVIMNGDGRYIATVYAERFERFNQPANSATGAQGGHFVIGNVIVGSFEFGEHDRLLGEDGNCGEMIVDRLLVGAAA